MEKITEQELERLAELLIAFRDNSADQDEWNKRDSVLFDVEFEFKAIKSISNKNINNYH